MSPTLAACCCADCLVWEGATSSGSVCCHNTTERLEYRCPRPAYEYGHLLQSYSQSGPRPTCPCLNTYGYLTTTSCPASSDIVCRFVHFHERDEELTYHWWYQKEDLYPPCLGLSPPNAYACCGYSEDADCCDTGPSHDPTDCASGWYQQDGWGASLNQKKIIQDGDSPALVIAGAGATEEGCTYGDGYKWLDGVANEVASGETFTRYFWNTSGHTAFIDDTQTTTKLSECILGVFHRSKWWTRDATESGTYNSLDRSDVDGGTSTDRAASDSRTPEWWVWFSAGVVLTGFMVVQESSLSAAQQAELFELMYEDKPIPKTITDILEADGILGDPSDPGGGEERPWEITLTYTSDNTDTLRVYARSGGWTYACHDFAADPATQLATYWPQIDFRHSVASGDDYGDSCLTAAPVPGNDCECASTGGSCDTCDATVPDGCSLDPSPACGADEGEPCDGDIIIGNCQGCATLYWVYQLEIPSATYTQPYGCMCNLAYLWRYELAEEPVDPQDQAPRDLSELPDPANLAHLMPFSVSRAMREDWSPDEPCCGGEGIFKGTSSAILCPATEPQGADCDDDSCS